LTASSSRVITPAISTADAITYVYLTLNRKNSPKSPRVIMTLYQGWGEKDYRDVLAAVDHAIELGYADPNRLGVGGYSSFSI
jgi:dipeptidyl aminopeptidase/acylaminoacyl peptidase